MGHGSWVMGQMGHENRMGHMGHGSLADPWPISFTARRSYASAVLGVVILSVCLSVHLSVCHTRAFWLIQRTYRRYFYTTWKGNPSSQMWFFVQLCSSWQDFNWLKGSRGLSAAAELLVIVCYWCIVIIVHLLCIWCQGQLVVLL